MFKIIITNEKSDITCKIQGYVGYKGLITIGDFEEHIDIQTGFWGKNDYINSWRESRNRLLAKDGSKAVFFTQVLDPRTKARSYVAECWAAYRVSNRIYIQTYYLPPPKKTDLASYKEYLANQPTEREQGVSEWKISLGSIIDWTEIL